MRRRIRLTGRKQLSKSVVKVELAEVGSDPVLVLTLADKNAFKGIPDDANVSLRLVENKRVEVVSFGTIGKLSTSKKLQTRGFVAPSCQLRIADGGREAKGRLIASTDNWTLGGPDDAKKGSSRGIISFLPDDTHPQSWKLEIRDADYPLVRVDKRISNAGMWAKNDPIFVGTALPTIIGKVFDIILRDEVPQETDWVRDWLAWAQTIAPDLEPPDDPTDRIGREDFIDRLVDSFCSRHELADQLLKATLPGEEK